MKLTFRPAAIADIQQAAAYIEATLKNPSAAQKFKSKILQGTALLKENPHMGMSLSSKADGVDPSVRFIVVSKQLIFYEVHDDRIEVIRVLDGRTDYLARLFDPTE